MVPTFVVLLLLVVGGLLYRFMHRLQSNDSSQPVRTTKSVGPEEDLAQFYSWITPTIAVGSFPASSPPQCWEHFDAILNVSTAQHENITPTPHGKHYKNIGFVDGEDAQFSQVLPFCLHWLQDMEQQGHKILVHCAAGASRSVSVVAAHLKGKHSHLSVEEILQQMKAKRAEVDPHSGFVNVLKRW